MMASTMGRETLSEYRTIGVLAQGGMGQVELAVRVRANFQRLYAVKRLRPEYRRNEEFRLMFLDEGRIAGLLRHPNIVSVVDVGEDEGGPYLVMDLVEGLNASAFIAAHRARGEEIPEQIALRIVRDVALGLDAAHDLVGLEGVPLDLIHRDVSPQNILVDFDGTVKVTDFGIAKALGRLAETSTGLLKGKAGYMSPEQLRFEDLDRRSDLFSLGVVLYELLAGQRLYRRETATEVARAILVEPAPDIMSTRPSTHHLVCELLFELLAKKPEYRPANAGEVAERLSALLEELAADEGEITLREYMGSTFESERAASAERQKSLMLEADVSSVTGSSTRALRRRTGRRRGRASGFAVAALAAMALGLAWSFDVFGSDEGAPAEAPVPRTANALPEELTPAQPVAVPTVPTVREPAEAAAGEEPAEPEMAEAQAAPRERRRRREGRRRVRNATNETPMEDAAEAAEDVPEPVSSPSAAMTSMTREAGTRARSHAVAF